jgi:predicted lipoprotein with Yx(FWY)xxD motif
MMRYPRIANAASLSVIASFGFGAAAWSASVQINTAKKPPFGTYLTDSTGRTVYMFTADMNDMSMCSGACTKPWPAVVTMGAPTAGSGVQASALGTIANGNARQVTYYGHPLYYFIRDKSAGTTAGEGITHFGGSWYVVSPEGKGVQPDGKVLAGSGTS